MWLVNRCACDLPRSFRFLQGKGCDFGSSWPDVMVSVMWLTHADPTLWLEGAKRHLSAKRWNSLSACFYGLVSSIQKKFFTPIMSNSVQSYVKALLYWSTYLFIKNRMILEYKVTLLVLKLLSESYTFSVVSVINFSWRKVYFFYFWKPGLEDPKIAITWQKSNDSNPGLRHSKLR